MVERAFDVNPGELSACPPVLATSLTVSPPDLILNTSKGRKFRKLPRFFLVYR